jgi:uncharacterized membrane protein
MWILSITPDWVFHVMLIAGILGTIAGFALGFISVIKQYIIPIRIISIVMLVFGLFMEGAIIDNQAWQLRVKEVEAKLAKAEAESAQANTQIVEKATVKVAKQKEKTIIVKQYIDREVTKYDSQCVIPKEFIKAHNDAAEQAK